MMDEIMVRVTISIPKEGCAACAQWDFNSQKMGM
jgi:hypothetical protein